MCWVEVVWVPTPGAAHVSRGEGGHVTRVPGARIMNIDTRLPDPGWLLILALR